MVAFGFAKRTLRVIFQLSSGAVWELCLECGTTPSVVFVLLISGNRNCAEVYESKNSSDSYKTCIKTLAV